MDFSVRGVERVRRVDGDADVETKDERWDGGEREGGGRVRDAVRARVGGGVGDGEERRDGGRRGARAAAARATDGVADADEDDEDAARASKLSAGPNMTYGYTPSRGDTRYDASQRVETDEPSTPAAAGPCAMIPSALDAALGLPMIDGNALARSWRTERVRERAPEVCAIDCRFPYEYAGGHVRGAVNMYLPHHVQTFLTSVETMSANIVFVFYCEFSSERARACGDTFGISIDAITWRPIPPSRFRTPSSCNTGTRGFTRNTQSGATGVGENVRREI